MTNEQLPERLRNLPGMQACDGKKKPLVLSDSQINVLAKVLGPKILQDKEREGA